MSTPPSFRFALAATITALRSTTGLTKRGLDRSIGAGVGSVCRYETAEMMPGVGVLKRIAFACAWSLTEVARLIEQVEGRAPATLAEARRYAIEVLAES